MPWYIPLAAALLGAAVGSISSFGASAYFSKRQLNQQKQVLIAAISSEISNLVNLIKDALTRSKPNVIVSVAPKSDLLNLCCIYRNNTAGLGMLSKTEVNAIIRFYSTVLTLMPLNHDQATYDATPLAQCIAQGNTAITVLHGEEKAA